MSLKLNKADPFLKRFEGRYEKIGAGGIKNVSLKESIENLILFKKKKDKKENPIIQHKNNQKMFSRMMNQYNILSTDDYKRISQSKNNFDNLIEDYQIINDYQKNNKIINNNINPINNNINNIKSYNLNNNNNILRYKNNEFQNKNNELNKNNNFPQLNHNNSYPSYEVINKKSIYDNDIDNDYEINEPKGILENERFYKPYSLKEYKKNMEDFKSNRFGGLGKNMNKEWKQREKIYNKVKKFENSVVKNFNEKVNQFNYKRLQSPQKMELIKIGNQIMNSKRFQAQKYGKGVMLKKVRDKIKQDKIELNNIKLYQEQEKYLKHRELERKQKDKDILNVYDNIINERKDNYMNKLIDLKNSLI